MKIPWRKIFSWLGMAVAEKAIEKGAEQLGKKS